MPIKIHHGAPGSYKTSGAMADDILSIIDSGRLIITNVRGFTKNQVVENFPQLDEEKIKVLNIDTTDPKKRLLFAKWFHWAPFGAMFMIDEAQMIFPKKWDKKFIESLDYEGGPEKAKKDGRPHDWDTAFEMHRHFNWDFVLTTPNIKKIRTDIRECSDGGFAHRDMGTVGINGVYKESYHSAIDNPSASNIISTKTKRINKDVFKLYQSTATDEFSYTSAGIKIWQDPKLLFALLLASCAISFGWFGISNSKFFSSANSSENLPGYEMDGQNNLDRLKVSNKSDRKDHSDDNNHAGSGNLDQGVLVVEKKYRSKKRNKSIIPFSQDKIHMVGMISGKQGLKTYYKIVSGKTHINFTDKDFEQIGFKVNVLGDCFVQLVFRDVSRRVLCDSPIKDQKQPRRSIAKSSGDIKNKTKGNKKSFSIAGLEDEGGYRRAKKSQLGFK